MSDKFGYLRQDDSSHWYLIPEEGLDLFDKLCLNYSTQVALIRVQKLISKETPKENHNIFGTQHKETLN